MRRLLRVALAFGCLLLTCRPTAAQQPPLLPSSPVVIPDDRPVQLSDAQERELAHWLDQMSKWQRAEKRWPNQPAHDAYGRIVVRRPQPEAPDWLSPICAGHDEAEVKVPLAIDGERSVDEDGGVVGRFLSATIEFYTEKTSAR